MVSTPLISKGHARARGLGLPGAVKLRLEPVARRRVAPGSAPSLRLVTMGSRIPPYWWGRCKKARTSSIPRPQVDGRISEGIEPKWSILVGHFRIKSTNGRTEAGGLPPATYKICNLSHANRDMFGSFDFYTRKTFTTEVSTDDLENTPLERGFATKAMTPKRPKFSGSRQVQGGTS